MSRIAGAISASKPVEIAIGRDANPRKSNKNIGERGMKFNRKLDLADQEVRGRINVVALSVAGFATEIAAA